MTSSVVQSRSFSQFQAFFFFSGYHPPGITSNFQISLKGYKSFIASCGLIFLVCAFFQSFLSTVPKTKYSLPIISGAFFSQIAIRSFSKSACLTIIKSQLGQYRQDLLSKNKFLGSMRITKQYFLIFVFDSHFGHRVKEQSI